MLILIGTVPTAYALNRAMPDSQIARVFGDRRSRRSVEQKAAGYNVLGDPRPAVTEYVAHHESTKDTFPSLAALVAISTSRSSITARWRRSRPTRSATPATTCIWRPRLYGC